MLATSHAANLRKNHWNRLQTIHHAEIDTLEAIKLRYRTEIADITCLEPLHGLSLCEFTIIKRAQQIEF